MKFKKTYQLISIGLTFCIVQLGSSLSLLGQIRDVWSFNMAVQNNGDQTSFEFFREEGTGPSKTRVAVRVALVNIYVGEDPRLTLWEIASPNGRGALTKITYGVVPEGFIQTVPKQGPPPPLKVGEEYFVSATGEGIALNSFIYQE